jgi:acyl dehydratase
VKRSLHLSEDLIRAYSRRGNFHSDPAIAGSLGLRGLVAQGVQVAGPAYGLLLDEWGEAFLAHGTFECTFVGMVTDGHDVTASVELDARTDAGTGAAGAAAGTATFTVTNDTTGTTAVVGRASIPGR